jgi:pantoate--beta-alanine ligase
MNVIWELRALLEDAEAARREGRMLGLVPTMGAFHEGHCALMRRARAECDTVVVSLFVNPLQFGAGEDLDRYPRDFERDRSLAAQAGVDILFAPPTEAMVPPGFQTYVEVTEASRGLCGATRPGHFRGVATIVAKLLHLCRPQRAYFGMKDYQQTVVLEQMVRDLNFDLELVRCPTVREADGLAMSSRNGYLTSEDRSAAIVLHRALTLAESLVAQGARDAVWLREQVRLAIASEPRARLDYVEVVDARTLAPLDEVRDLTLVAVAAHFGPARLLDNVVLNCGV